MMEREPFLMKPKNQYHLSQREAWVYSAKLWKKSVLLRESVFIQIDKWTLIVKNDGNRSFSYETKASMSFIPMRRMSLWCSIMKRKEIAMWIHAYLTLRMNINYKESCGRKSFSYQTKALISCIPMKGTWL